MKQILKTALAGILAGVAIFMLPFVMIKILIFFLLVKSVFRLMGGGHRSRWRYAYVRRYQNMSDEERKSFVQKQGEGQQWRSCSRHRNEATEGPENI